MQQTTNTPPTKVPASGPATVADFWLNHLNQRPPLEAAFFELGPQNSLHERGLSPRQLFASGHSLAGYLLHEGLEPGQRVLVLARPHLSQLTFDLALALLGAPSLWVSAGQSPRSLQRLLAAFKPSHVLLPSYADYCRLREPLVQLPAKRVVCQAEPQAELQLDDQLTVLEQALAHGLQVWRTQQEALAQRRTQQAPQDTYRYSNPADGGGRPLSQAHWLRSLRQLKAWAEREPALQQAQNLLLLGSPAHNAWWLGGVYLAMALGQRLEILQGLPPLDERLEQKGDAYWLAAPHSLDALAQRQLLRPGPRCSPRMAQSWNNAWREEQAAQTLHQEQAKPSPQRRLQQAWRVRLRLRPYTRRHWPRLRAVVLHTPLTHALHLPAFLPLFSERLKTPVYQLGWTAAPASPSTLAEGLQTFPPNWGAPLPQ